MKKPLLLTACAAVLLALTSSTPVLGQAPDRGVAVIDLKYIFDNYPRFKQEKDRMDADVKAAEAHIQAKKTAIDGKKKERAEMDRTTPNFDRLDNEITKDELELRALVMQTRKRFLKQEANMYFRAYKEIVQEVDRYATHFQFSMVLRFNSALLDQTEMGDVRKVAQHLNKPVVWLRPNNPKNVHDANNRDITEGILDVLKRRTERVHPPVVGGRGQTVPRPN